MGTGGDLGCLGEAWWERWRHWGEGQALAKRLLQEELESNCLSEESERQTLNICTSEKQLLPALSSCRDRAARLELGEAVHRALQHEATEGRRV